MPTFPTDVSPAAHHDQEGIRRVAVTTSTHMMPRHRAPSAKPPFSVGQLKRAIPAHCFHRSLLRSSSYLAIDLLVAAALFFMASHYLICQGRPTAAVWSTSSLGIIHNYGLELSVMVPNCCYWVLYWIAQGCVLTGVWVIAHECGHHAFSNHAVIDDAVGLLLHSCLLVPYFSWKYSHRRHHSNTGSMDRDEVFVPCRTQQRRRFGFTTSFFRNPIGRSMVILGTLTLGWPSYLLFNASGRHYGRFASHFDPNSPIFNDRERLHVVLSDLCLLAVGCFLYKLASLHGIAWLIKMYAIPLLIVNGFLVLITYLQHTHPALPHYSLDEWEWLRGALSTVDRDYGILNHVFHHITDTHVVHHIFSTMPHYHAKEATEAIRPILGAYYQFDGTSVPAALWREFKECVFVKPQGASEKERGIFWYSN